MTTDSSPARQVATALGLSLDATAGVEEYARLTDSIEQLVARGDVVIPHGRSAELAEQARQLAEKISTRKRQLKAAQKQALAQLGRGGPVEGVRLAIETLTADPIATTKTELAALLDADLAAHREQVDREDRDRRTAVVLAQRAELLLVEFRRLAPEAEDLLAGIEALLDQAGADIAEWRYREAKEQAQEAIARLAKLPDPLRDLPTSKATALLVEKVGTLKQEILTSPLTDEAQTDLLDRLGQAGQALRDEDSDRAQTLADQVEADLDEAVQGLADITAQFKGLLDTAGRALNTLSLVAGPLEYVDLQVALESSRGNLGRVNPEAYDELVSVVERLEERRSRINAAFEDAANGLARLEGFVKKVTDLRTWHAGLNTPFVFPIALGALLADEQELQDGVHARAIQAHELAPKANVLLDGLAQDEDARDRNAAMVDAVEQAVTQVTDKTVEVERSLKTLIGLVNTPVEAVPEPSEGSIQHYQVKLDKLREAWEAAVGNAWKSRAIDPAPTLETLGELQAAIERCDPQATIDRTKLETARAAYRAARQAALDHVGKAMAVQGETDEQPGNILVAINEIDLDYQSAGQPEQIDACSKQMGAQRRNLESFINWQAMKVTLARKGIVDYLAEVSTTLEAIAQASAPSIFYPQRRARVTKEKKYAAFLASSLVPELKLFEGAELLTVLYDALRRVLDLKKDVAAIHASVVDGEPLDGAEGKTFDEVIRRLALVNAKLNDGHLKKFRKSARAKFLERLKEIEDLTYERAMGDTTAELDALLDDGEGIPVVVREAKEDARKRKEFDDKTKDLKKKLKSNARAFSGKFTDSDLEAADAEHGKVPTDSNARAYLKDLVNRLNNLTKLSKEEGAVSETLPKLDDLEEEIDGAIADPKKRIEGLQKNEDTETERMNNREAFKDLWDNARNDALKALASDAGSEKEQKEHLEEVERDFKAAKASFEASGKLDDARELIQSAKEKAEFYGLGTQEAKAKYARQDLAAHAATWATNVGKFEKAVDQVLAEVVKAVDADPEIALGDAAERRIQAVIGKLERMFDEAAFHAPVVELVQHLEASDKRKARAVREAALARIRGYQTLVDSDPDILLLDMAPTGGFGHASAALKQTLTMLERTFLVAVPEGE